MKTSFQISLLSVLLFFMVWSCTKDEDVETEHTITITLNPGEGLTTTDLEGLVVGIVKLPDGTTEDDNLDSLAWTSEPVWNIGSFNSNGAIVFEDIASGLYLLQMDNDTLEFETFTEDPENVYIQVDDKENTQQSITIILKEAANNLLSDQFAWSTAAAAENAWTLTAYCYDDQNSLTATFPIEPVYIKSTVVETFIVGYIFSKSITDMYQWEWAHHNLRDEYYKIEVQIINNNDSSSITKTIYPASRTWFSHTYIDEEVIIVGNNSLYLDCSYQNTLGNDYFNIAAAGHRE